ncbi:hypothetical protein GMST_04980 [Geomonas silvestris]|uniref:Diguanylate cyclase n=1 Tax=Geomonas silvestris TaxID=2740184 RepID=A0A6V8MEC0_9BACT|nr:sensor domain-containing diguanylate cyclase [Geomonas silvestris]GFO58173.1 hypothetical protein GMST_04980 [Geomonas silvestris]
MATHEDKYRFNAADDLRLLAEKRLRAKASKGHPRANKELQRLVHELEVHQIELELQNEELGKARVKLEAALGACTDLYDFAPVGYLTLNRDGKIISVNLLGTRLLQVERSRLIGRHLEHFVAATDRDNFTAFFNRIFTSQAKEACEVTLQKGEPPLVLQIEAMPGVSGQTCLLALIDITERKQLEIALRESEDRMYKLAKMAADAIVMLDDNGRVTFANAAAEVMFGCPGGEITGGNFHTLFLADHIRPIAEKGYSSFRKQGTGPLLGRTTEVVALRKDGSEFPVELSVSALDIKGTWHSIAIMRDVTERKSVQEKINKVVRQQQAILDNIPNIAWLKDTEGRYVAVNEAFSRTVGLHPQELVGKYDHEIYPPERAAKHANDTRNVMSSSMRTYFEESNVDRQGNVQHVEKIETPIFNDNGKVIGVIGITHDITSRKELELDLRHDSTHDTLTSLYNRAFFEEELKRFSHGRMLPLSIVMGDVNGLKRVNDTQGHAAGDELIRLAARIILEAFRAEDIVARIGGDEFAVLLPGAGRLVAAEAVERIMSCPEIITGQVSIAFGIATAESNDQIAEALRLSDERMYQHKTELKSP